MIQRFHHQRQPRYEFGTRHICLSYTYNNPLAYTDPSGFEADADADYLEYLNNPEVQRILAEGCLGLECTKRPPREELPKEALQGAQETSVRWTPTDVGTFGNVASSLQPTAPEREETASGGWLDVSQYAAVQAVGGFLAGLSIGFVPAGGLAEPGFNALGLLNDGQSREAHIGKALGEIVGGSLLTLLGAGGEVGGISVSASGIGALLGVPAVVVSGTMITGGVANVGAGVVGLKNALMSTGGDAGGSASKQGTVSPFELRNTERIKGRAAEQKINELAQSMEDHGWQGKPIKIFEHNGRKYILDGHHRAAAARRSRIDVPYESIPASDLGKHGFKSADDVIGAAAEAMGL